MRISKIFKQKFFLIFFSLLFLNLYAYEWIITTQADFEDCKLYNLDTKSYPDDVLLRNYSGIDQRQMYINASSNVFSDYWIAQTFFLSSSGYVDKIKIYCEKIGNPPNPLFVEIRDCLLSDLPGNTILASSQNTSITGIGEYEFIFEKPPFLSSGRYSIVIYTFGGDDLNHFRVYYYSQDVYPNGRRCTSNDAGNTWTITTVDNGFKVYNSSKSLQIFQPNSTTGKDAYVDRRNPNTNYGTATFLSVERRNNRFRRSYLQFDELIALPVTGTIDSAFLNLYQYNQAAPNNLTIQLRRVTSSWQENTITFNNQPTFTTTSISSITTNSNGWKRWNATEYVQGWYLGSYPNYGFILISALEGRTLTSYRKSFYSSDYNPSFLGNGLIPYLEVYLRAYVDSGYLISPIFDADIWGEPRWCEIRFNATIPNNTELKFQIATSEDGLNWNFLGPDGTPFTYYTTSGTKIWSGHYGDRYLRVKAYFKTKTFATPILHDFSILYFKDYYVDTTGDDISNYGRIDSPFKTIHRAGELMKGSDGCIVRNGIYTGEIIISNILSGTEEYPTFFINAEGDSPIIDVSGLSYGFLDTLCNHLKISGFKIKNALVGIYSVGANNITFENNHIEVPDYGYGILILESSLGTIRKNKILPLPLSTFPFEGIWIYGSSNIKVCENDIRNLNDCGLLLENSSNCSFYQNLSVNNMFGIDIISSSSCSLYNNTFDGNLDAGIHANMLTGTIYTVNNNITNNKFGFGWCDGSGYISSDYNNVWNNTINDYVYPSGFGVTPGSNDISLDPLYTSDYHLSLGSPCIDAGLYVGLPYSGNAPDIGAFEYTGKSTMDKKLSKLDKKTIWGDDVRLTNNLGSSYLTWSNTNPMFMNDSIIGIVFYDNREANYEIYFMKSNDKGDNWEEERRLTFNDEPSIFPSISYSNGKLYLIWCEELTKRLLFKTSSDLGDEWTPETSLATFTNECSSPSIVTIEDKIHIFYSDKITGDYNIYILYKIRRWWFELAREDKFS